MTIYPPIPPDEEQKQGAIRFRAIELKNGKWKFQITTSYTESETIFCELNQIPNEVIKFSNKIKQA